MAAVLLEFRAVLEPDRRVSIWSGSGLVTDQCPKGMTRSFDPDLAI